MPKLNARALGITGAHVLAALSGGADSVALVRLLADMRDEGEITLSAAHFEHGIRGEASVNDMRFTEALCRAHSIALYVSRADVPLEAARTGEGMESAARRLRYAFLEKARAEAGADWIALAHHMDDQAETVLMHILRGSGTAGASGMREKEGRLLRPLLSFSKRELIEYLTAIAQPWREDQTNYAPDTPRNAIRLTVMPALDKIYPGCARAICRFADNARKDDAFISTIADEAFAEHVSAYAGVIRIKPNALNNEPILARILLRLFPETDAAGVSRAFALTEGGACELSGGVRADRRVEGLYLTPPMSNPAPLSLPQEGEIELSGICRLRVERAENAPIPNNGLAQTLDADALAGSVLRTRAAGDYLIPLGMRGKKSLGDYLTDRGFPKPLRQRLPLIARGREVLWAPGVGISQKAALSPGSRAKKLTMVIDTKIHDKKYGGCEK